MNNSPNENVNQQTGVVSSTSGLVSTNNNSEVLPVSNQPVQTITLPASSNMPVATPTVSQVVETPGVPMNPSVTPTSVIQPSVTIPTAVTSSSTVAIPQEKSKPVAPQQDRVQLINDKPKLHAVIGTGGVVPTSEKKEEQQVQPEIVATVPTNETPSIQPVKGSKLRTFFLFVLFGGLFLMIIFLPDISNYIETQKYLKNQPIVEKITTGILKCSMKGNTNTLDYTQSLDFYFTNNSLNSLTFITETRGDISLDEEELDKLKSECDQLFAYANNLEGISVSCELLDGTLTKKQTFDYADIVQDKAITAYVEAGGAYPLYENGDNIDRIEENMNAENFTCERVSK